MDKILFPALNSFFAECLCCKLGNLTCRMGFGQDFKYSSSVFIGIENFTMHVGLFYVFVYVHICFMAWEHKTPGTQ